MTKRHKPSYLNFDLSNYSMKAGIDYRQNPEVYKVGKDEREILVSESYKIKLAIP